jgi:hypothetical protein
MDGKATILKESDYEKYTEFILSNEESQVFHTIEWKNVLEKSFKYKPCYIISLDDSDKIQAIMPLFFVKNLIYKKLVSIPYSSHGGVLGDERYVKHLIKNALEIKKETGCKHIEIRQPPSKVNYNEKFQELGMSRFENRINHFINLIEKNPEELWMNLSSKNRGAIRKAQKNNVNIEKLTDEKDIKHIHNLESINRKYQGLPTANINYYKNMWRELNPKKYLEILVSKYNGKHIAFAIFFKFKNKVVHIHVGSNDTAKKLGANNLILWNALENACRQGFEVFDFGASVLDGKGNITENFKGIYSYKCSFNTTNLPYAWYYYPKEIKNIDTVSKPSKIIKFGSNIIKYLPMPLYKKTGTFFIKKFS